ncbi:MAG: DUF86 domain-containing protein [Chloroflexi bacterium]|nr:DUF86 domain-containing protein [Chloroflexota bacterium]
MTRNQRMYCRDILDRIRRIERYTTDGRAAFLASELHQDGVIRSFEVIGEVVKRLDSTLQAQHPDVAWSDFAGFRDVLIHQYDRVRLDLVWRFAQEDLPALKRAVAALLRDLDDPAGSSNTMRDG